MQAKAIARLVRMSPRKVRLVVDQIRGKSVNEAYAILQFSKKAAADPVGKTLRSAVANAQKFKKMTGMTWRSMVRDGMAMRHGKDLTWSQVVMAANTPMLLKAGLVEGNTEAGVLASGQVAGILDGVRSL